MEPRRVRSQRNQYKDHTLHWRHNGHDGVSNHQPCGCLLNRLFRCRSKKASKLRATGLCAGNSPGPVNSLHKGPVTRKMFPFHDVIMNIEQHDPHFTYDTFKCIFPNSRITYKFVPEGPVVGIGSGNGLTSTRRPAITWTSVETWDLWLAEVDKKRQRFHVWKVSR